MYPTDPHTVRQLRQADHIVAAERRRFARWDERQPVTARVKAAWASVRKPLVLDPKHALFAGLSRRSLRSLGERFEYVNLAAGESPIQQGDSGSTFTVVLDGSIGVTIDELPVAVFDTGSHFGALPLLDGGPDHFAVATFRALEPTHVAVARSDVFDEIIEQHPLIGLRVRWVAARRRAYLQGHADAKAMYADRITQPFPVHVPETV